MYENSEVECVFDNIFIMTRLPKVLKKKEIVIGHR